MEEKTKIITDLSKEERLCLVTAELAKAKERVNELSKEEKTKILNAKKEIEATVEKYGHNGVIALALCSLEFAQKENQ
jgi:hypothetical protein